MSTVPRAMILILGVSAAIAAQGAVGQESATYPLPAAGMLFTARRDGNVDLYYRADETPEPLRLTDDPAPDNWGVWSRDGRRIAFQSQRDGNYEIYLLDARTGETTNWSRGPSFDGLPVWSPDGSEIAYFSDVETPYSGSGDLAGHIYVRPVSGGPTRRITAEPLLGPLGPSVWTTDGTIYFSRLDASGGSSIVALDVADGHEDVVYSSPVTSGVGSLSPDGSTLTLYVDDGTDARVALLTLRDSRPEPGFVSSAGMRAYYPRWAPDGEWILFTRQTDEGDLDLEAIHAVTGERRPILITPDRELEASFRPVGDGR